MNVKKKFQLWLFLFIGLDLLFIAYLGYRYLDRKVPDEIFIEEPDELVWKNKQDFPFLTFDDAIEVSGGTGYRVKSKILGVIPFKEIKVEQAERKEVLVSGEPIGLYMETEGVLVVDTGEIYSCDGMTRTPAENIVCSGDYILEYNHQSIQTKKELVEELEQCEGEDVCLTIKRKGEKIPVSIHPVKDETGAYKLGIWVRDNTQGIGTLTYVEENGKYGALGHGISDIDTGKLLEIQSGSLYNTEILSVQKGSKGIPGELAGIIRYNLNNCIGDIQKNTEYGVFGRMINYKIEDYTWKSMPIAFKQEIEIGPATIVCNIEGETQSYQAQIIEIDLNHENCNKSFILQVTDEQLLQETGGIVQGMSGSPILQNGKIIGAITHVFVNDPTKGYGIFIEKMLEEKD